MDLFAKIPFMSDTMLPKAEMKIPISNFFEEILLDIVQQPICWEQYLSRISRPEQSKQVHEHPT